MSQVAGNCCAYSSGKEADSNGSQHTGQRYQKHLSASQHNIVLLLLMQIHACILVEQRRKRRPDLLLNRIICLRSCKIRFLYHLLRRIAQEGQQLIQRLAVDGGQIAIGWGLSALRRIGLHQVQKRQSALSISFLCFLQRLSGRQDINAVLFFINILERFPLLLFHKQAYQFHSLFADLLRNQLVNSIFLQPNIHNIAHQIRQTQVAERLSKQQQHTQQQYESEGF